MEPPGFFPKKALRVKCVQSYLVALALLAMRRRRLPLVMWAGGSVGEGVYRARMAGAFPGPARGGSIR